MSLHAYLACCFPVLFALINGGCVRFGFNPAQERDDAASAWEEIGGSASGNGISNSQAMVNCKHVQTDGKGTPYATWSDGSTGQHEIYLRFWDGQRWASLGTSGQPGGISQNEEPAEPIDSGATCYGRLDFDRSDRPHVAWMNQLPSTDRPAYLRYWNGQGWQGLAGSDTGGGISGLKIAWWPDMVLPDDDRPVVAWSHYGGVYLRRFDGLTWVELDGSDTSPGVAAHPADTNLYCLASGPGSTFYVAWCDNRTGEYEPYMRYWTGSAWEGVGGSDQVPIVQTNRTSDRIKVRVRQDGRPVVAWADEHEIYIRVFDGGQWQRFGAFSTLNEAQMADDTASFPALALDQRGYPVVAWEQIDSLGKNIYIAAWDGSRWQRSGLESIEGGISATALASEWPSVDVGPDNRIYVSWEQVLTSEQRELYLKTLRR